MKRTKANLIFVILLISLFFLCIALPQTAHAQGALTELQCNAMYTTMVAGYTQLTYKDVSMLAKYTINGKVDYQYGYRDIVGMLKGLAKECPNMRTGAKALVLAAKIQMDMISDTDAAMATLNDLRNNFYVKPGGSIKYADLAEEATYLGIEILYKNSQCSSFLTYYAEYKKQFPAAAQKRHLLLDRQSDACASRLKELDNRIVVSKVTVAKKKLDILVFNYGWNDQEEFKSYASENFLNALTMVPFWETLSSDQSKDKINVYAYDVPLGDNDCKKEAKKGMCSCDESKLKTIAGKMGIRHYFVLMQNKWDTPCRSNANYDNDALVSILSSQYDPYNGTYVPASKVMGASEAGTQFADDTRFYMYNEMVILHESGHALWSLADEYVEDKAGSWPQKPNCVSSRDEASRLWSGIQYNGETNIDELPDVMKDANSVGIFKGCSYVKTNYRPVKNSIMNDDSAFSIENQAGSFGPVNDAQIKKILDKYS